MAQQPKQGIGKRITDLRKRDKLTQEELAGALNTNRSSLNMWERGQRELKAGDLQEIADYFGVTVDYLIYGREAPYIDIYRATGLSQAAIEALKQFKVDDHFVGNETKTAGNCDALSKALANSSLLNILSLMMRVRQKEPGYYESAILSDDGNFYLAELSPDSYISILFHRLQLIIHAIRKGDESAFAPYPPAIRREEAFDADPRNYSRLFRLQQARDKKIIDLNSLNNEIADLEKEGDQRG